MVLQVKMFQGVPNQLKTIVALELWYPPGLGGLGVGPKVKVLEYLSHMLGPPTLGLYRTYPLHY